MYIRSRETSSKNSSIAPLVRESRYAYGRPRIEPSCASKAKSTPHVSTAILSGCSIVFGAQAFKHFFISSNKRKIFQCNLPRMETISLGKRLVFLMCRCLFSKLPSIALPLSAPRSKAKKECVLIPLSRVFFDNNNHYSNIHVFNFQLSHLQHSVNFF